jgi:D-xylonolactonase
MSRGAIATWRDGQLTPIVDEIPAERESRFNDVIADPAGRVFCGTMPTPQGLGRLYRLDLDGSVHVILENIGTSNGIGFTLDRRSMYYTDSAQGEVYRFDYDLDTGALSNQQVLIRVPEENGRPDGLTVDAEGHIWSARWDGSAVYRFTPDGLQEQRIDIPARKVSSVTFGGDALSDLYVTTALDKGTRATEGEGAGALFRLRPGVRGLPEFLSRIRL